MTNLNEVKFGLNKYCGPAVLSIVTGKSTDECADAIAYFTRNYQVTGVYFKDLKLAADKLGFKLIETPFVGRSLYSAITSISNLDGIYIVELKMHYVCIEIRDRQVWFNDNHTKEPMPAASSARLMNGVVGIHKVEKKAEPKLMKTEISIKRQQDRLQFQIYKTWIYDIESANHSSFIGSIRAQNFDELEKIVSHLNDLCVEYKERSL